MPTMEIVPVLAALATVQSQQAQPPATAADQAPPPAPPPAHGSPSGGNVFLSVFLALVAALAFAYMLVALFRSVRWRRVHGKGQAGVGDLEAPAPAPKPARVRPELKAAADAGGAPPEQVVKMKQVIQIRVIPAARLEAEMKYGRSRRYLP